MPKVKGLTRKQKGFVKDYIDSGNGTQAALKNYDIESPTPEVVAGSIATENLKKPQIQRAIAESLPDDLLAEKHLALLNKQEVRLKNNNETGEIDVVPTGEIDVIAVSKGLDMAYKLKGSYAPEKSQSINLNFEVKDTKHLEIADKYEKEIKESL